MLNAMTMCSPARRLIAVLLSLFVNSCSSDVNLPFGDINVMVVTDTHSWVGGHGYHEPDLNADYGDVLSFYERLREHCNSNKMDLWFVMNGDFVHGTGLSENPPVSLVPLLEKMPWDIVNIGNHELEEDETVAYMTGPGGFVDWWGDAYLTSNVVHADTMAPLGERFRILHGKHQQKRILTFGFLYDMEGASKHVIVERVEDVVHSKWFIHALTKESFDAIMVLAHMDVQDPLVTVILDAIRKSCGSAMPVQFITGHTHYRGNAMVDSASSSFEAGRYLDTVGFVSFPTKDSAQNSTFQHVFLNANKDVLRNTLGVSTLSTEAGSELSEFIRDTQESLGLLEVVGCSPGRFYESYNLTAKQSLWGLYLTKVVPYQLFDKDSSKVLVQSVAWYFRYDLFPDRVTVTDIASVVPIDDSLYHIATDVPGSAIQQLVQDLGTEVYHNGTVPSFWYSGEIKHDETYHLYTIKSDVDRVTKALKDLEVDPNEVRLLFDGNRTVRSLWSEFVGENWPCGGKHTINPFHKDKAPGTSANESHSKRSMWGAAVLVIVAVLGVTLAARRVPDWLQRCAHRSMYRNREEEITLVL